MKALIVEIKRKYCIIVTPDGKFLKKTMPAGSYEIGDEILIGENDLVMSSQKSRFYFGLPARIAAGFAIAALITTGAYFGVRYISMGSNSLMVASAPAEAADADKALKQGSNEEQPLESAERDEVAKEQGIAGAESQDSTGDTYEGQQQDPEQGTDSTDEGESLAAGIAPPLFSGSYSLDAAEGNEFIPSGYDGLDISYRVEKYPSGEADKSGGPGILWLQVKNTFEDLLYNGNITVDFLDGTSNIIDSRTVDFISFGIGTTRIEKIYFGQGNVAFSLMVNGEIK